MLSALESAATAAVQPQKLKITAITDNIFDSTQTKMDDLIEELSSRHVFQIGSRKEFRS